MENLINDICQKTGLDRETAEKFAMYLKDNLTRIPELLQGVPATGGLKGIGGGVSSKLGDVLGRHG
ncbi:MAG TPA: hypothetical protein VLM85_00565 [Polyangiaceae bacterium]|nr:hypothetical protein [Polyangiaceae bacterium]